jgi:hypothetical protein
MPGCTDLCEVVVSAPLGADELYNVGRLSRGRIWGVGKRTKGGMLAIKDNASCGCATFLVYTALLLKQ